MTDRTSILSSWRPGIAPIAVTQSTTASASPVISNVGAATEDVAPPATPRSRSILVD